MPIYGTFNTVKSITVDHTATVIDKLNVYFNLLFKRVLFKVVTKKTFALTQGFILTTSAG